MIDQLVITRSSSNAQKEKKKSIQTHFIPFHCKQKLLSNDKKTTQLQPTL